MDVNSIIVVEGKRDVHALRIIGVTSRIVEFHKYCGMNNFIDTVANYEKVIILFDGDRTGKQLTARITKKLQRRTKIDVSFKKRLVSITKGKIRFIEQMSRYESSIANSF